jgi:uncharacterized protein (TIGR02246 family)
MTNMNRTSSKTKTRAGILLAVVVIVGMAAMAILTEANAKAPQDDSDVAAIRAAIDSYVAAYNRGDSKAVAALWSESGEWLSPSGQKFQGREAIEREMQSLFDDEKGVHIEVLNPTIRIVSPDTAIEEGTVRVTHPTEPPSESTYIAVDVKENGQWKLNTVRETDLPDEPAASSELGELSWLAGDWVDDSPNVDDTANVTWTKNKTFLTYSFKLSSPDSDDELEGTQIIGWDPSAGTIRSWMFDSDGGFGEGTWSKHGDTWVVKFNQVLPDGRKASATNVYTMINGNGFTWKSIGRKVDDEFLPNIDEVKMVRKAALEAARESDGAAIKARKGAAKK